YYIKRFLIENPEIDELFITEHPDSQLHVVSTDAKPVIEMVFYKERGKDQKENEEVLLEEFIAVKGIKALGNQLYTEKLKQINQLEPIPVEEEEPEEPDTDVDDVDEYDDTENNGDGQGSLF
ncbi:MAG: DNA gyrase/topoisomerase IV subunit A, partial [Leeuwenhoekiella sp.]